MLLDELCQSMILSSSLRERSRPSVACPGYVVDHVKALKRGDRDDPSNMQWQIVAAKATDRWE
jgi:hypothetical protein